MTSDLTVDEIPPVIKETTEKLLADEASSKTELLECAAWWCRNAGEDNVVVGLIVLQLYIEREPPTPHQQEQLEDERDTAIYHLKSELPELVPDGAV